MIANFIASKLFAPVAGGVVLLLVVCLGVQSVKLHFANGKIGKLEGAVAAAKRDLGTCQANRATLEATLAQQNKAVEALRAEAEARVAESRKAVSEARKSAARAQAEARRILAAKPKSDDLCEAARMLIAEAG